MSGRNGIWLAVLLVTAVGSLVWSLPGQGVAQVRVVPARPAPNAQPTTLEPPLAPGMTPRPGAPEPPAPPGTLNPVDPPEPRVSIRVRVAATAHPGQELEYRILVDNPTPAAAHHVRVRANVPNASVFVRATPESKPEGAEVIWQLGTLTGGTSKELILVVKPTGTDDLQCCARVQFEHGECVRTRLTQPKLAVRILGPTQSLLNDTADFQIEVTNAGQREAAEVVLTNTLPEGIEFLEGQPFTNGSNPLTWKLGNLAPGKSAKVSYRALLSKTGSLTNKAVALDAKGLKQETTSPVLVGEPKLALAMTGPERRGVGRTATYQITVSNPGSSPTTHVLITNAIPPDIAFLGASVGGQLKDKEVRWNLGTLAPGARQTMQLNVQARKEGRLINVAEATADRVAAVKARVETAIEGAPGLNVEIDKSTDPLEVGKTGTYTVRVVNQGSAAATEVQTTLTVPEELKVTGIKGPTEGDGSPPWRPGQEGQKITFNPREMAPGAEAVYTVTTQAVRGGEVRLRVELTAKELTAGPIRAEESTTIYNDAPALAAPRPPQ